MAALLVGALGACRADLSVEVDAAAGGAGHVRVTVTLDRAAATQVEDLARQLRVEDLEATGWVVEGPSPVAGGDGSVRVHASKRFTSPSDAAAVIDELSGADGPFSTLRLTRHQGLWRTTTELRGTVDLAAGLGAFADPALDAVLGAPNLGLDPAAVERDLGGPLVDAVRVELVGRLDGTVTSNAPRSRAGASVWPVAMGSVVAVSARSEALHPSSLAFAGVAVAAFAALVGLMLGRRRRRKM